ncbi:D-cysteine desulfhydrase family protein [Gaopeijia maritima]|uniref:D-cysteine desulfhydrase family protein n=1 Tax=Gaopeijia maritima TaxID=3119007 RepID=UPI0032493AE5
MNLADLRARLAGLDRLHLASLPTPLRPLPRLRAALGPETPEIRVKLDEETGFGLGGNKVRKLEFELAPERLRGATHLVTTGGPQSNHCRVTAAAAAKLGLGCVLVINGPEPESPTGNARLHRIFGARIRTVASRAERTAALAEVADEIAGAGGRAVVVPLGASTPHGALGYVQALLELHDQLPAESDRAVHIVVSSSSGGTLAGLWAGLALLDRPDLQVSAISADTPALELRERARALAEGALELLQLPTGAVEAVGDRVEVFDDQVGEGYGLPTPASEDAAEWMARSEGILVDRFYTAKAAAGMIAQLRSGRFPTGDRVVFWHTGGHPAVLA